MLDTPQAHRRRGRTTPGRAIPVRANSQPFLDLIDDGLYVGKLPGPKLRVHQVTVDRDLETAAAGRLELEAL